MGLKTTNYYVESMKEILPEAYAVIRTISIGENDMGVATIGIHRNRELVLDPSVKPYETKKIYFKSDRKIHDRETIYKKATQPYTEKSFDENTGEIVDVVKYPPFYGWLNDIHEGE